MNLVPNRSRMTPTSGRSGDSFISQLLGVIATPMNTKTELAMYQAKSDIDTDSHAKRIAHDTAAKHLLGEQTHGHRNEYADRMIELQRSAGLKPMIHRMGDVESTPFGQAAAQMWRDRQEDATGGAPISQTTQGSSSDNTTSTGPGTNPADVTPISTETDESSVPQPPKPRPRRPRNTSNTRKSNVDIDTGTTPVSTSSDDLSGETGGETVQPSGTTPRPSRKRPVKPNTPEIGA